MIPIPGLVVVGDQAAERGVELAGLPEAPVVPDDGAHGEQVLRGPGDEARRGVGAVALERELVLVLVEDRLDPPSDPAEVAEARCLVAAVGVQEGAAEAGDERASMKRGPFPMWPALPASQYYDPFRLPLGRSAASRVRRL
jgi:hypothetical protein